MKSLTGFVFMILCITTDVKALAVTIVKTNAIPVSKKNSTLQQLLTNKLLNLKQRDIARLTGKRLTLKNKIALLILQHKTKRQLQHPSREKEHDNGKTAFILGLIGLICLVIPFLDLASIPLAILAITIGSKAKKENPYDRKARTGITLGIVTLALLAIIGFTVAIVLIVGSAPR